MRGAEARSGAFGNCVGQPHKRLLRVALMGAAIGRSVIGRLRPRRIRPERQWITLALHFLSSLSKRPQR